MTTELNWSMPQDDITPSLIGGKYELRGELGQGGSATVYLAYDASMDRLVAVKVLRQDLGYSLAHERFSREIRVMARLEHPHILPVLDTGTWGDRLYYVMPFVEGETLEARLREQKQLSVDEVLRLAHELCDALAHAHGKGIVHRDIKPSNILVGRDGHARLSDFGIARALDLTGDDRLTISEALVGTLAYMSPEQHARERRVDGRSDVFSLGMVLFECLAGRLPFEAGSAQEAATNRLIGRFPSLRELRGEVPVEVEGAIARALAPDPVARWGDAREFAGGLGVPLGTASRTADAQLRSSSRLRRRVRRVGLWSALAGAGSLLLSAIWDRRQEVPGAPPTSAWIVFAQAPNQPGSSTSAGVCSRIRAVISRWVDLEIVDQIAGKGSAMPRIPFAGAGRGASVAILCETIGSQDREVVRLTAAHPGSGNDEPRVLDLPMTPRPTDSALTRLVATSLRSERAALTVGDEPLASKSFRAVLQQQEGLRLFGSGDFVGAADAFARAVRLDSELIHASIWRAYSLVMAGLPVDGELARLTAIAPDSLAPDVAEHVLALRSLLKRNPVEASTRFSAIAAKGAATLPALLGLAESTMRDSLVVTSRQSPSGWRFRSNHQLAREALVRAADLAPKGLRAVCLERAAQLYIREPQQIRMGYADSVTKEYWFGLPSLYRDSVVVFPFSPSMHAARARESVPSTYAAALARERQGFYELTKSSAEELPRDARARSAFASALELRGQIAARGDEPDALKELVAALSLTSSEHERTEVRRAITRIRLKRLETGAASRVIDTLLTRTADSSGARDGLWKAALAAFRDDMAAVSTYLAAAWSDPAVAQEELGVDIDATTRQALAKFTAAVALGVCDSLASFEGQLEAAMRALVAPNDREIFRARTLGRLWSDATPCDHGARVRAIAQLPTSYATAQRSYARKDYHAARRQLLAAAALRGGSRGADQSWDAVFQEAWLHAAIGDTVTAIAVVEQALTSLPSASRFLTEQLSQAAGFVRAIRLKLDLTGRTSGQQQDRLRSVLDSLRAS